MIEAAGGDALTPSDLSKKLKTMISGELARTAAKVQAEKVMFLGKREQLVDNVMSNIEKWKNDIAGGQKGNQKEMAKEALRVAIEGGSLRPGEGTNRSLPLVASGVEQHLRGIFREALNGVDGLKEAAASGALDRDMFQELDALVKIFGGS